MENESQRTSSIPESVPFEFLKKITNHFSESRILGRGGFGIVYKGEDENGNVIAVKKLYDIEVGDKEFLDEIKPLMNLKHPNIVQLKSYCYHVEKKVMPGDTSFIWAEVANRLLCLEYVPKGSLERSISDESRGLDWNERYTIIKGICKALHYLHECLNDTYILHLDLKPNNILLDESLMPKITDFGLSRLLRKEKSHTCTQNIRGTRGYIAPEYWEQNIISKKTDIYSLGVLMIEIIIGQRKYPDNIDMSSQEFIETVCEKWRRRLQTPRNISLEEHCQQIKICIEIGLNCMERDPNKRPSMADIIRSLSTRESMFYKRQLEEPNQHANNDKGSMIDETSTSFQRQKPADKIVEEATSVDLEEPDWDANIKICGMINSEEVNTVDLIDGIMKRIMIEDTRVQNLSLMLLETIVGNCGDAVPGVAVKRVVDKMGRLIGDPATAEDNRNKAQMLIEAWRNYGGDKHCCLPVNHETYKSKHGKRQEEDAIITREEDEDELVHLKGELFSFTEADDQWINWGTVTVQILKHKHSGVVRLLIREAETLNICASHLVCSIREMEEVQGTYFGCTWKASVFKYGVLKDEEFKIWFESLQDSKKLRHLVKELNHSERWKG